MSDTQQRRAGKDTKMDRKNHIPIKEMFHDMKVLWRYQYTSHDMKASSEPLYSIHL